MNRIRLPRDLEAGSALLVVGRAPSSWSWTLALCSSTRTFRILLPDIASPGSSLARTSLDEFESDSDSEQEEEDIEREGGGGEEGVGGGEDEEEEAEEEEEEEEEEDEDEEEEEEEDEEEEDEEEEEEEEEEEDDNPDDDDEEADEDISWPRRFSSSSSILFRTRRGSRGSRGVSIEILPSDSLPSSCVPVFLSFFFLFFTMSTECS